MGKFAEEGRSTNQTHRYQAENVLPHSTVWPNKPTTGYLAEIRKLEKDADSGPKKTAALEPLRELLRNHDDATRAWHHRNCTAALENLERNRPSFIQRETANFLPSQVEKLFQAKMTVKDVRAPELLEMAKIAAAKRDSCMLFAIRTEVQTRMDVEPAQLSLDGGKPKKPWAEINATLDSAHAKELRAAEAEVIGAQWALFEFDQKLSSEAQLRAMVTGMTFRDPGKAASQIYEAYSVPNEDGTMTGYSEAMGQELLVEAGAIDQQTVFREVRRDEDIVNDIRNRGAA